jgi:hypothetical protein
MGNRANIEIKYQDGGSIFLYSHWDGVGVDDIVKRALSSKRGQNRLDDESYLARIIFSEMIKDDVLGEIGYGISPYECEEGSPKCVVNMAKLEVCQTNGAVIKFSEYKGTGLLT